MHNAQVAFNSTFIHALLQALPLEGILTVILKCFQLCQASKGSLIGQTLYPSILTEGVSQLNTPQADS